MPKTAQNAVPLHFDSGGSKVSALLLRPALAPACYVLAHGAGAGKTHPFMESIAVELAARGVATFRYQFPYMEKKSRRPDPPKIAEKARAAYAAHGEMFKTAIRVGVPIALGTDAGVFPHGMNAMEFGLMTEVGMTPSAALRRVIVSGIARCPDPSVNSRTFSRLICPAGRTSTRWSGSASSARA